MKESLTQGAGGVINRRKWNRFQYASDKKTYVNFVILVNGDGMPEPVKMEVQKPVEKGENPGDSFEERLTSLLITVLTKVIHILLTEVSTSDLVRKLLGGKAKR